MNGAAIKGLQDTGAEVVTSEGVSPSHRIDGLVPEAVVFPSSLAELSGVLDVASREGMAVAPWGGGTQVALGNAPERLDAVVDLSRLDRVVEHNPADLTATVEAGITVARLQETLAEHRQFLAIDPPLPDRATVGGALATGVSGPLKWQYGSPRDVVIGMKVVQADGKVTKSGGQVVKNVSGYDMSRLHVGGLGTLGVIAEVSFKLTPLPAGEATLVAAFDAARPCLKAALGIFHSDVVPLAITAFDSESNGRMRATGLDGDCFLAVRLGGRPRYLDRQVRESQSICEGHGPSKVEVLRDGDAASVWRRLADFGWNEETAPTIGVRASVLPSAVPELVDALQQTAASERISPAVLSHPAHGTVLAGWAGEGEDPAADEVAGVLRDALEAVRRAGGAAVIERCPAGVKSSFDVWGDVDGAIAIMRRLKEQYDPTRVLNPGRFGGGI